MNTKIAPQQVFGIIDPDYARIYTQARVVAWQFGYSCSAQGSFTRDLDLLLVPWTESACKEIVGIVMRIADVAGLKIQGPPTEKPHGRRAWSLLLPGSSEVRWVDISAFASQPKREVVRLTAEQMDQAWAADGEPLINFQEAVLKANGLVP